MLKKVSICLLTYMHEKYISDALDSILDQKYPYIELIILNDGSSDLTNDLIVDKLDKLNNKYQKVIYINHDICTGNVPHNCNEMVSHSTGEYVFFMSGDDIVLDSGISELVKCLEDNPSCGLVHANAYKIDDDFIYGDNIDGLMLTCPDCKEGMEDNVFSRLMMRNYITAPTVLIRKKTMDNAGPHDEAIPYEDYEYWLRLSLNNRFYFLNKAVVLYRQSQVSLTNYNSDNLSKKLKKGINSDYLTRKKYELYLPGDERHRSWKEYYERTITLCLQYGCQDEMERLYNEATKIGIQVDVSHFSLNNRYNRICREADILAFWVDVKKNAYLENYFLNKNIHTIAIYGCSRLGLLLEKELRGTCIEVKCFVDKQGDVFSSEIPVRLPEADLNDTDAMVVAPLDLYDQICEDYQGIYYKEIIDIEKLIYSLKFC